MVSVTVFVLVGVLLHAILPTPRRRPRRRNPLGRIGVNDHLGAGCDRDGGGWDLFD